MQRPRGRLTVVRGILPMAVLCAFTIGCSGSAAGTADRFYATTGPDNKLVSIEISDGSKIRITPIGTTGARGCGSVALSPDGTLYSVCGPGLMGPGRQQLATIDPKTGHATLFGTEVYNLQVMGLEFAPDGTLFASDPNWKNNTGQVWRIDKDGNITRIAEKMGTANGIEVSPDGKTLYVNESIQRNIWAFTIAQDGSLANKRLLKKFDDHGFDGMRCDVDGNLYITRHGKGTVVKLSPSGDVLREVDVLGSKPSNLCFGGPDGRTVYVTEVDHRRLVQFRVDRPGLAFVRLRPSESQRSVDSGGR